MIIYFTLSSVLTLLLTFAEHLDTRRPMSTKLKYKYRVKDDSIFRKIIKFKDKNYCPCNYFKIVPIYIYLILSIFSVIMLLFDLITNGYISSNVPDNVLSICTLSIFLIYLLVVIAWWEIVDYKEFRFTKEEKEELKQLRKFRKENKKNN